MAGVDIATLAVKVDTRDLAKARVELDRTTASGDKTDRTASKLAGTFKTGLAVGAASVTAVLGGAVSVAADLETRLVAVQKTTDFTATEMVDFRGRISDLSREVPVATTSLLDMAGVAGQLGIKGVDNIAAFTETMGKLTLATDIVGDEGAASVARLLNVTGEGIETVGQFGSVLVALGNNSAATESEILSLATQVGQATSTFSVTASDTAALGAAMKSMGVSAELGGSVVGRTMRAMEDAINAGGNQLQYLSDITGIAAEDLKSEFGDSATAVFQQFVEGVGSLVEQGETASSVLDKFGLRGEEVLKVLPTMAVNADQLGKALDIANDELERGSALDKEVANASTTLNSQWQIAKNIISDYSAIIGEQLAPFLGDVISDFKAWDTTSGELLAKDIAGWIKGGIDVVRGAVGAFQELDNIVGYFFGQFNLSWSELTYLWDRGVLGLKSSFSLAFDDIRETLAHNINVMGEDFGRLPIIGEDIREKFRAVSEDVKGTGEATAAYESAVAKLDAAHNKEIVTIKKMQEALVGQRNAVLSVGAAEEETAVKSEQSADKRKKADESVVKNKEDLAEREVEITATRTEEQDSLETDLADRIMELSLNEHDYKLLLLEQEEEALLLKAGNDKALQDQVSEYMKLKEAEIYADFKKNQDDKTAKFYNTAGLLRETNQTVVDAVVSGENLKTAVAGMAADRISGFAVNAATEGLGQIMEGLGQQVGAWVGLGTAEATTDGESWFTKLASGASYLAGATAAVLAGKAVGNNFADGGWLSRNPGGGTINEGSGVADDVLLSVTKAADGAPIFNMGMGGEFVNNKDSTRNNYGILNYINTYGRNKKLFADGGNIDVDLSGVAPEGPGEELSDFEQGLEDWEKSHERGGDYHNAWEDRPTITGPVGDTVSPNKVLDITESITNSGMTVIGTALLGSIFDWGGSMLGIIGYYVGTALGMIGGKEIGEELFTKGGYINTFTLGGLISEAVNLLLGVFGFSVDDIWDELRSLDAISKYAELLDAATLPFVRDTATPGKSIGLSTFEDSVKGVMDEFGNNFLVDSLWDMIPGGDLLEGILHNGGRVRKTGAYLLQEGEEVRPLHETTRESMITERIGGDLQKLMMAVRKNTEETARILRKFDNTGLPESRGF